MELSSLRCLAARSGAVTLSIPVSFSKDVAVFHLHCRPSDVTHPLTRLSTTDLNVPDELVSVPLHRQKRWLPQICG